MKREIDVLVLEDDPDLCLLMQTMLKFSGLETDRIENPALLNAKLLQVNPKLLLMDMLLSGSDGRDICRKLKGDEAYQDLQIMMVSAHPDADETCRAAGADDFLGKPFDMEEFLKKVNNLVGLSNENS